MTRRDALRLAAAALAASTVSALPALGESTTRVEVWKTPSCGCCGAWIDHMRGAGFEVVAHDVAPGALQSVKNRLGVAPEHSSCHTALVEGYVVEGHVPAEDLRRLLALRPEAVGLSVPGMPIGSPGMEMGDRVDPYDTLLLTQGGGAEVFASRR